MRADEQMAESGASDCFCAFNWTDFCDVLVCYGILQKSVLGL